jgi:phenylacetate-CoA ligase
MLGHVYSGLPTIGQHAAVTLYGLYWKWLRFAGRYEEHVASYERRSRFDEGEWRAWQSERLKLVLGVAAARVPYYRREWSERERAAAIRGQLEGLPLLGKEPLRAEPLSFCEDRRVIPRLLFHTSGSTGTPIRTYWTVDELRQSLAVREARSARWAGVSFRQPRATFSGRMVVTNPRSTGPFHRFNAAEGQVYFSAFHVGRDTAGAYLDALRRHGTQWATGYSGSFASLARFAREGRLEAPKLRAIVTTSEKLSSEMREEISAAFRCGVFEEYSTVENACFVSECERGSLHVSPDVGVVEILRPNGEACAAGEVGEVVVTSLSRIYQPLIRFRLGDLARWSDRRCRCGRAMPIIEEVVGRLEHQILARDGREMVRFHGVFVDLPGICEGQVVQVSLDQIRINVVAGEGFTDAVTAEIVNRVRTRLGDVEVDVALVDSIARTSAGKFPAVVSLVSRNVT